MAHIAQWKVRAFIDEHPEILTAKTMKVLDRLDGNGLIKREGLSELIGILRDLGWEQYIPAPSQSAIFDWLYQIKALLIKLILIKKLKIEPGVMVMLREEGPYRVKSIGNDFSITLEGRPGGWNPMHFKLPE